MRVLARSHKLEWIGETSDPWMIRDDPSGRNLSHKLLACAGFYGRLHSQVPVFFRGETRIESLDVSYHLENISERRIVGHSEDGRNIAVTMSGRLFALLDLLLEHVRVQKKKVFTIKETGGKNRQESSYAKDTPRHPYSHQVSCRGSPTSLLSRSILEPHCPLSRVRQPNSRNRIPCWALSYRLRSLRFIHTW